MASYNSLGLNYLCNHVSRYWSENNFKDSRPIVVRWLAYAHRWKNRSLQGVSREDAEVLLSTGKDFQTYLAGQAGWQEKTKGKDNADVILRPLLKIMCRYSVLSWNPSTAWSSTISSYILLDIKVRSSNCAGSLNWDWTHSPSNFPAFSPFQSSVLSVAHEHTKYTQNLLANLVHKTEQ